MSFVIEFYRKFLIENRVWLRVLTQWFGLAFVCGAIGFLFKPELLVQIVQMFTERFGSDPALDASLSQEIFTQNLAAMLVALLGGVVFGLTSLLALLFNGFLLGFVLMSLFFLDQPLGTSVSVAAGGLVPHAIFELPALILSCGLGLRLGVAWTGHSARGQRWLVWTQSWRAVIRGLPLIVILLIIAAVIEVFVSGRIVDKL